MIWSPVISEDPTLASMGNAESHIDWAAAHYIYIRRFRFGLPNSRGMSIDYNRYSTRSISRLTLDVRCRRSRFLQKHSYHCRRHQNAVRAMSWQL